MAEWAAYFRIEPDSDTRNDSLLAQQLAMLGNINRSSDKTEPFVPTDFMPWIKEEIPTKQEEPEPIDMQTQTTRLMALFGSKGNQ